MSVAGPGVRHVVVDDVSLAVFEEGNPQGPTLVLVHGWPDTHELWRPVIAHLADRFRIVSYDTRGAGASSAPAAVAAYALPRLARDLFAVIDAVSPDAPVHLLAHDWGAIEAWEAVCEPGAEERIASYTSISGPNLDHLGLWMRRRLTERRPAGPLEQAVASTYTMLFRIPGLGPLPFHLGLWRIWPRFLSVFDGMDPALVRPAPTLAADMVTGLRRYRANIGPRLRRPRQRRTDVPVQLIIGRRDRAVRPVGYEDTERWVTHVRRRELAAGHWSPLSHAADVARLTAVFVDDLDGGTAPEGAGAGSA